MITLCNSTSTLNLAYLHSSCIYSIYPNHGVVVDCDTSSLYILKCTLKNYGYFHSNAMQFVKYCVIFQSHVFLNTLIIFSTITSS